eukprot:2941475-Pyramimonas_sp.AAC.1
MCIRDSLPPAPSPSFHPRLLPLRRDYPAPPHPPTPLHAPCQAADRAHLRVPLRPARGLRQSPLHSFTEVRRDLDVTTPLQMGRRGQKLLTFHPISCDVVTSRSRLA